MKISYFQNPVKNIGQPSLSTVVSFYAQFNDLFYKLATIRKNKEINYCL